jgi:ribosomal protein L7/L12
MDVPIPYLVAAGLLLLLFAWLMMRRQGGRDLIAPPPAMRAAPRPAEPSPEPSAPVGMLEMQVRAHLSAGRKIEAIKVARSLLHLDLREAKELVEAIEHGAMLDPGALPAVPEQPLLLDELRALVANDRKIEAIKRAREELGLGLAEAKMFVETMEARDRAGGA